MSQIDKTTIVRPETMSVTDHPAVVLDTPNMDLVRKLRTASMDVAFMTHTRPRLDSVDSVDYRSLMYGEDGGVGAQEARVSLGGSGGGTAAGAVAASRAASASATTTTASAATAGGRRDKDRAADGGGGGGGGKGYAAALLAGASKPPVVPKATPKVCARMCWYPCPCVCGTWWASLSLVALSIPRTLCPVCARFHRAYHQGGRAKSNAVMH
jgi:hypothetical protein